MRGRLRSGLRRHGVIPRPAELARLLRAADVRFTSGNSLELYRDGASGLRAMLDAIESAAARIHLETYILRTDATGRRFIDALAERARAGVEVRVLYDAVGSRGLDPGPIAELRAAGADVTAFNPLRRFYPHWAPRRRDHRKILVIDGALAFTGGLNIGDEYALGTQYGGGAPLPWRDAHVRLEGPAVRLLEAVFLESWFRADGPDRPWADLDESRPPATGETSVGVVPDGPTYHRRRMRDLLVEALGRAQFCARFATPYFVPGAPMRQALVSAARRGVVIEILVAGYSDHPFLRWAARGRIADLIQAGVRIYEYERSMMHAKVAVFDDGWAVLGTSNLDRQSLQHSYEVNLVVEGGGVPEALSEMIRSDVADAEALTSATLGGRSLLERARDRLAAFFASRW